MDDTQIQNLRQKYGIKPVSTLTPSTGETPQDRLNFLKGTTTPTATETPIKTAVDFGKEMLGERKQVIDETTKAYSEGKIGLGQAFINNVGQVIGGAFDIPMSYFKAVKEGLKSKLSPEAKAKIDEQAQKPNAISLLSGGIEKVSDVIGSKLAEPSIATYENASNLYNKSSELALQARQETDPEKKKKILDLSKQINDTANIVRNNADDIVLSQREAGKTAEATVNIGTLGIGAEAKPAIEEALAVGRKTISGITQPIKNAVTTSIEQRAIAQGEKAFTSSIDEAKKILNPSGYYTPAEKTMAYQKGNVTSQGRGLLKKEVINPPTTPQTETISNLVQEGKISAKKLPSQNIEAISQETRAIDSSIDEIVNRPELNKPFNNKTLDKVFEQTKNTAKKDLVFVSDTVEEKAYQEVINVAKEEIAKHPYNSSGLRQAIKAFNKRMERILGSDIYSGASESIGNARLQAAKDMRSNLNNFLADNLESPTITKSALANQKVVNKLPAKSEFKYGKTKAGSIYKSQLQKEAQLLNARDEIAFRASKNIDKTKINQYLKKHPIIRRVAYYGTAGVIGGEILKEFGL